MEKCKIGENAGKVWKSLNDIEFISIPELARKLNLSAEHTAMAVGWLAKENQISINKKDGLLILSSRKRSIEFQFG